MKIVVLNYKYVKKRFDTMTDTEQYGIFPLNLHLHFTFSHLADAFIQSDLHMCDLQCIHILHLH